MRKENVFESVILELLPRIIWNEAHTNDIEEWRRRTSAE